MVNRFNGLDFFHKIHAQCSTRTWKMEESDSDDEDALREQKARELAEWNSKVPQPKQPTPPDAVCRRQVDDCGELIRSGLENSQRRVDKKKREDEKKR